MRVYGRVNGQWEVVETAPDGSNDLVYLTNLIQVLLLNLNESPFYAAYGIPAQQTIATQVYPDYYVQITQKQFAQFFQSLIISKVQGQGKPVYNVAVVTHRGTVLELQVPK